MAIRTILFCRVSTTQQDYQRQISDLKPLIKSDGFNESEIMVIKHKESAIKNDINNRKSIAELKDAIENNPIEAVYCTEASRLARRGDVLYGVLALLEEHHISLVIQTPTLIRTYENGKPNAIAHVVIAFLGQVAQQEMELKKERQKSGYEQKKKEGKVVSSRVKFGYTRDKEGYAVVNNEQAIIVNDIFKLYIDGMSVTAIWDKFEHTGIFKVTDNKKSAWNMITNILRDKTYIGRNEYFRYPPIIDDSLFFEVQNKMDSNQMIKSKTKHIYYCQGLLKVNGHTMTPNIGKVTYMYRDPNTGGQIAINMNAMDSLAWNLSVAAKAQMNKTADSTRKNNINKELETINLKLIGIKEAIQNNSDQQDRVNNLYIKGKLKEDKYNFMIADLEGQLEHLLNEQDTLNKNKIELNAVLEKTENAFMQGMKDFNAIANISDDGIRQQIIKECIEKIELKLTEKGVFEIHVFYVDKSLNDDSYYKYIQKGCKKYLYCCYDGFCEDWTSGIEERIKREQH